eukprot:3494399-Amphidinium_carterae.1
MPSQQQQLQPMQPQAEKPVKQQQQSFQGSATPTVGRMPLTPVTVAVPRTPARNVKDQVRQPGTPHDILHDVELHLPSVPGERIYCPVPSCPKHNPLTSAGWMSLQSLRPHLEEHQTGRLQGEIPKEWLQQRQLHQCQVCHKLIAARFGPSCP